MLTAASTSSATLWKDVVHISSRSAPAASTPTAADDEHRDATSSHGPRAASAVSWPKSTELSTIGAELSPPTRSSTPWLSSL